MYFGHRVESAYCVQYMYRISPRLYFVHDIFDPASKQGQPLFGAGLYFRTARAMGTVIKDGSIIGYLTHPISKLSHSSSFVQLLFCIVHS